MAITRDSATKGSSSSSNTLSYAHTVSGTNRALFVVVQHYKNVGGDGDKITGVTYPVGGVATAMTQLQKISYPGITTDEYYIYGILNPDTGANNIVISSSVTADSIAGYSVSYNGVDTGQTLPDAANSNNGVPVTTISTSLNIVKNNCWIFAGFICAASFSSATNLSLVTGADDVSQGALDSNGALASGATTISVTGANSGAMLILGASFAPAPPSYNLAAAAGSLTLTANNATFSKGIGLLAQAGQLILTGYNATIKIFGWKNQAKSSSSWSNKSKNSTAWTNQSKS